MARLNDTQYNLLNTYTGEYQSFNKVTTWLDGTSMTDAKCDGTIFRKKGSEYFKLNWTGPVNVKWFGAKGDGVTDDSVAVQKAINAFRTNWPTQQGGGVTLLFPEGTFKIKNIRVPAGISLISYQLARDNYLSYVPSRIITTPDATYVFEFDPTAKNCEMIGIYIDAEFQSNPNLVAAVRWNGSFNKIINCNFTRCPQHAVLSNCGGFKFVDNNLQGWYGPAPVFTDINDFRGVFHAENMGDSYIADNEIGAGLPYFQTYPDPMDMLRDRVNRRIAAFVAKGYVGTSVISGNLFENGDRGVVLAGSGLYCTFHHNRYELSGGTGLTILNALGPGGGSTFFTFTAERFSDNSLAGDGVFEDIFLAPGAAGYISFIAPIFEMLASGSIPTSTFKVKWNINNQASTSIELLSPQADPNYSLNGLINNQDVQALPVKQAVMQYDPLNPLFNTVSTKKQVTDTQTGYVTLIPGTTPAGGNLIGGVQFYDSTSTPKALIGFNGGDDLWFDLNQPAGSYIFVNGPLYATKAGGNTCTINTTDNSIVALALSQNNGTNGSFSINLLGDNTCVMGGDHDFTLGLVTGGSIRISPNGKVYLPFTPGLGDLSTASIVGRNTTNGEVVSIPASTFVNTLQTVTDNGRTTSHIITYTPTNSGDYTNTFGLHVGYVATAGLVFSGNPTNNTYGTLNITSAALNITANNSPVSITGQGTNGAISLLSTNEGVSISSLKTVAIGSSNQVTITPSSGLVVNGTSNLLGQVNIQGQLSITPPAGSIVFYNSPSNVSGNILWRTSTNTNGATITFGDDSSVTYNATGGNNFNSPVKLSSGLRLISTGVSPLTGTATFAAGTTSVDVSTQAITTNSIIMLTVQSYSGSTTENLSSPYVVSKTVSTGFTIGWGATGGAESGSVSWMIIEKF